MGPSRGVIALSGGGRGNSRLRAVVVTAVPEAATLSDAGWRDAETIIARALAARPARVRRQLALFLRVLDVISIVRHGRPLAALGPAESTHLLEALSQSRLLLLRRGVWGLRTLAFMGYYARPEAAQAIGYRASAAGWDARARSVKAP